MYSSAVSKPSNALQDGFEAADAVLRAACAVQFTGAVARVEHQGQLVFERAYGVTRADDLQRPVYVDTRFDLASIGKVFVATAALRLVERGVLHLDAPLTDVMPEWRNTPHETVTLRMLLAHTGGFASGADFRTLLDLNVEAFALTRPLVAAPGERVVYSDLGFIALGAVLPRASKTSLPSLIASEFARPSLGYVPRERERRSIPATEEDGWRGRVQGVVHDEKAYLMYGIAGHAGLFGTAADVAALARGFLDPLQGRAASLVSAETARLAVTEAAYDPVLRRGLGWALKTNDSNSCGRLFADASFGHTGFVGTCVWADPQRDLMGVLLTNTVYFGRNDSRELRAAFFDAIAQAAGAR